MCCIWHTYICVLCVWCLQKYAVCDAWICGLCLMCYSLWAVWAWCWRFDHLREHIWITRNDSLFSPNTIFILWTSLRLGSLLGCIQQIIASVGHSRPFSHGCLGDSWWAGFIHPYWGTPLNVALLISRPQFRQSFRNTLASKWSWGKLASWQRDESLRGRKHKPFVVKQGRPVQSENATKLHRLQHRQTP